MRQLSEQKILVELKHLELKTGLTINDLRVILALERAVARIEAEPKLADNLIFKGGFVLFKSVDTTRYTRDVDALANGISIENVANFLKIALNKNLSDCLWFCDVQEAPLPNQGPYGGLQFSVAFQISSKPPSERTIKKLSRIHIDIGFGDSIILPNERSIMTSLLPGMEPVSWLIYPLESVLAEKLEALLRRGSANSRAKDVYDLVLLLDRCPYDNLLKSAINSTFSSRNMPIPNSFAIAFEEFDTSILEQAWNSVFVVGFKKTFKKTRIELIRCLAELDRLFSKQ